MTKRAMRIRKAASISLALASLLVVVPSARADKKKDAAPKKVELVWPLPPDKPRVRWDSIV